MGVCVMWTGGVDPVSCVRRRSCIFALFAPGLSPSIRRWEVLRAQPRIMSALRAQTRRLHQQTQRSLLKHSHKSNTRVVSPAQL